jgi:hypothetical protein
MFHCLSTWISLSIHSFMSPLGQTIQHRYKIFNIPYNSNTVEAA